MGDADKLAKITAELKRTKDHNTGLKQVIALLTPQTQKLMEEIDRCKADNDRCKEENIEKNKYIKELEQKWQGKTPDTSPTPLQRPRVPSPAVSEPQEPQEPLAVPLPTTLPTPLPPPPETYVRKTPLYKHIGGARRRTRGGRSRRGRRTPISRGRRNRGGRRTPISRGGRRTPISRGGRRTPISRGGRTRGGRRRRS
jgi:hypothetical protein